MEKRNRILLGVLVGLAVGILFSALGHRYLSLPLYAVLTYLLLLAEGAIAALIANSTRKTSAFVGILTGLLNLVISYTARYVQGIDIYPFSGTFNLQLFALAIVAEVLIVITLGTLGGMLAYRILTKKPSAKKVQVPSHKARNMAAILISAVFTSLLIYGRSGVVDLLGIVIGSMLAAALSTSNSRKAYAAFGIAAIFLSFVLGTYPEGIYNVDPGVNAGTSPPFLIQVVNATTIGPTAVHAVFAIFYLILGGIGGLSVYYIKKAMPKYWKSQRVLRMARPAIGIILGALLIAFISPLWAGTFFIIGMPLGGILAVLIAPGSRNLCIAYGVLAVLLSFALGTLPGFHIGPTSTTGAPPSQVAQMAINVALFGYLYGIYALAVIFYLVLGGIGGLVGYYITKTRTYKANMP